MPTLLGTFSGGVYSPPEESSAGYEPSPTDVAASTSSVMLMDANDERKNGMVYNDSFDWLYISFVDPATASGGYVVAVPPGGYYELPYPTYRGAVYGIWDGASGYARVTEVT